MINNNEKMNLINTKLNDFDPEIYNIIRNEEERLNNTIELIASENVVSNNILAVNGSILTNKYAEGYPNNRYYGGCVNVDEVEQVAIERLKQLFGCEHANVQPHSGSSANMAVYSAVLKPNDTVLSLDLNSGGHLTHGSNVSFSGMNYNFIHYGLDPQTELINYEQVRELAIKHKPKLIIAGYSNYSRVTNYQRFADIANEVGCMLMVDMAHIAGLVAAGLHPNPVPYADFVTSTTHKTMRGPRGGIILCKEKYAKAIDKAIFPGIQGGPLMHTIGAKAVCFKEAQTSEFVEYQKQVIANARRLADNLSDKGYKIIAGGTDTHLLTINLEGTGKTGLEVENLLDKYNITVNKNSIPNDKRSPKETSGIRIGTAAVTSRGFGLAEMDELAECIDLVIKSEEKNSSSILEKVQHLCEENRLF